MIFNVNSGAGKIPVNVVPSTISSFTYDGEAKSPEWQNYDSEQLTISGSTSATNAGTYTVYFTPKADYEWWDGTSTPKEVSWSIAKAAGSLSLSATSGTITGKKNKTTTFTVTRSGDGKISVSSSSTSIATVSLSGTTVTITSKGYGSATITVSVAAGTNHNAPSSKTYSVKVDYLYLLNGSNKCTSVTGGWNHSTSTRLWDEASSTAPTQNSNGLVFPNNASHAITKNKINVTDYDTLYVSITAVKTNAYCAITSSASGDIGTNYAGRISTASTGTHSINVSSMSSSYYVFLACNLNCTGTVNKIWLA